MNSQAPRRRKTQTHPDPHVTLFALWICGYMVYTCICGKTRRQHTKLLIIVKIFSARGAHVLIFL